MRTRWTPPQRKPARGNCSATRIRTRAHGYPLRQPHADRLFELPLHHNDPFDRLLIATALSDDLPLISRDKQFRKYRGLRAIW